MGKQAVLKDQHYQNRIHPKKFALWIACASIMMMFASLTSAYIVRQAQGNWLEFQMPTVFYWSTVVIIISSITLHISYVSFKKGKEQLYKSLLVVSFILGILFLVFQYMGWQGLKDAGVAFTVHPAGDFVYAISGLHAVHILGGVAAMTVALVHAFSLKFRPTPFRKLRFNLVVTYWHFVDFLWIYLIAFFIMLQP